MGTIPNFKDIPWSAAPPPASVDEWRRLAEGEAGRPLEELTWWTPEGIGVRLADRIAIMYQGRIVEMGRTIDVFAPPQHPYTRLLVQSVPQLRRDWLDDVIARRSPAEPGIRPTATGCAFFGRCPVAIDKLCDHTPPPSRHR